MPQLTELHARIEALQLAEFLSEDEAFDLLDCVSDAIELRQTWLIQGRRRVHDTELELMITISKMVGLAQIKIKVGRHNFYVTRCMFLFDTSFYFPFQSTEIRPTLPLLTLAFHFRLFRWKSYPKSNYRP